MPKMTKYTAEHMLAQVKAKVDSTDPTLEALKLLPIPELKVDLSNYDQWDHALGFHLQYYGLEDLVECMKNVYPNGPGREDFNTTVHWHRWQNHCLHAYSIIYSQAAKVIEDGSILYNLSPNYYCPHDLLNMIREWFAAKPPFSK